MGAAARTKAQARTSAAVPAAAPIATLVSAITATTAPAAVFAFLALALLFPSTTVSSKVGLLASR